MFLPLLAQAEPLQPLSFGWLFVKMILAMVVVLALAIWFMKYWLPRFYGVNQAAAGKIKVLFRFGLEPRKSLYVINLGKKNLLVGVTDHQLSTLAELSEEDVKDLN